MSRSSLRNRFDADQESPSADAHVLSDVKWEYHSRVYEDASIIDMQYHQQHHICWGKMTKPKNQQMNTFPDTLNLQTGIYSMKYTKNETLQCPAGYHCYTRKNEYVFIRPIATKVLELKYTLRSDGIKITMTNPFTGAVELEELFHENHRLRDVKEVAETFLRSAKKISENVQVSFTTESPLKAQMRQVFALPAASGVRRRIMKKTRMKDSSSGWPCTCSGCVDLKARLTAAKEQWEEDQMFMPE